MTTKEEERKSLFGKGGPEWTDPQTLLLNKVLAEFPQEKQIEQITEILGQEETWNNMGGEQAIPLVEALEKLFENRGVAFRAHLMEVYNAIPTQIDGDRFYKEKTEAAPKLKLAILGKIIQGWDYSWSLAEQVRICDDAEKCFLFLCQSYKSAPQYYQYGEKCSHLSFQREAGKTRKGILDLFREHLERGHWRPFQLDDWILEKNSPDEIALVLLKARTRLGGLAVAEREITFLKSFDFHHRSERAIALVKEYMAKIRAIDGLAVRLIAQVAPSDERGNPNPDKRFQYFGNIVYELRSERIAIIKIVFWARGIISFPEEEQKRYPQVIRDVQAVRNKLLEEVNDPPSILIEAEGPNGFSYMEIAIVKNPGKPANIK